MGVLVEGVGVDAGQELAGHPAGRRLVLGVEEVLEEGQVGHLADELEKQVETC